MPSHQFVFKHVASYFLQTSCCLVGSPRIISWCAQTHNKYNLHVYILYIDVIISYSFKTARSPWEKHGVLGATTFFYHCSSYCLNNSTWSTTYAYYVWPWPWRTTVLLVNCTCVLRYFKARHFPDWRSRYHCSSKHQRVTLNIHRFKLQKRS